jgi:leucyl-tRNA synthetase
MPLAAKNDNVITTETQEFVAAALKYFDYVHKELKPKIEGLERQVANIVVADNVIRTAMEAALTRMMPFQPEVCAEMSVRLASYALSAAPDSLQERLLVTHLQALPAKHIERLLNNVRIETEWADEAPLH